MGLPQVRLDNNAEEAVAAPLCSFSQSSLQFAIVSTCDRDGIDGGDMSTAGDMCSSIGDFQRKTSLEHGRFSEDSFRFGGAMEVSSNIHGLKIGSLDKCSSFTPISRRNIQSPASRIVGFESSGTSSHGSELVKVSSDSVNSSSMVGITANETESSGSLVRKRLSSPLNSMLSLEKFNGDPLDISCGNFGPSFRSANNANVSVLEQDFQIENVGSKFQYSASSWSLSSCLEQSDILYDNSRNASTFFTDGPLLENRDPKPPDSCLNSSGLQKFSDSSNERSRSGAISISSRKTISPPLSLSPLGPKFPERIKTAIEFRNVKRQVEDCHSNSKRIIQSFDGPELGIIFPPKEEFSVTSRSSEEIDLLQKEFLPSSLESSVGITWPFLQESAPSPCRRFIRSLSGLPVRRSLVGSFEESLLSGRFFSGKHSRRIDGFLAVLSITGGTFSPQSQKLPFSVASVDGDCCLLYYASIDLSGNSSSNKWRGQKLKRGSSNDDSQLFKSRFRIPIKGRIQLTFMRQKVTLASPVQSTPELKQEFSHKGHPVNTGKSTDQNCEVKGTEVIDLVDSLDKIDSSDRFPNMGRVDVPSRILESECNECKCQKTDGKVCTSNKSSLEAGKKSGHNCSKVNKNTTGAGALRYALHLRFLCPPRKKCSRSIQRCKSDPLSTPEKQDVEMGTDRRFYLYNDLRVVFPQRHSDADEGKLNVEYHFPEDPRYFDISN
ncbi:hypothetical protein HS088_TW04G00630 [Tripterygium wilfordii]|uniref:Atos-like conserved domain-containing protein n=1 Tax=Tripterygium wilfordii TaxID=458696 RepID=A0A7J7DQJ2_TRIWF|nr:uncharacterized protein LOC119997088 isoform X2 [Tripterygium wilfordii]KAF5748672.1 hypothetical protein HS088_TW04G00630 [Tripterygium wilfordii]